MSAIINDIHCTFKNVVSNILQEVQQLLTDFENSLTVGNLHNKYSNVRDFLKTSLHYRVKHKS